MAKVMVFDSCLECVNAEWSEFDLKYFCKANERRIRWIESAEVPPDFCPLPDQQSDGQCQWRQDWEDAWNTDCDRAFYLSDGTPAENQMEYCCFCGRPLAQVPYSPAAEEVEE